MSDTAVSRDQFTQLPAYIAAQSPTEKKLAEIWRQALGMDRVGIADRYEDLGGNSLLAASIFSEMEQAFGVSLSMALLVDVPTIAQLARKIDSLLGSQS